MSDWHLGPLVAFDLETTGVDVETDRIVTACVARIDGTGETEPIVRTWLVDPGIDIPQGATDVHGITTERARAEGMPASRAVAEIAMDLFGSVGPIVAFNAVFDLTLLDRECRRHGIGVQVPSPLLVVDPLVLDKSVDRYRKGKRTLTAACEHYGVRLDGAHDASYDAVAAARIAWRIAQRYPEVAAMGLADLHQAQIEAKREQDASFADYLRRMGKEPTGCDGHWPVIPVSEVAR